MFIWTDFSHNKKQPLLIQSPHIFSKLLFESEHRKLLGPRHNRNLAKACCYKSMRCSRIRDEAIIPQMGNLPQQRLVSGGARNMLQSCSR